VKKDFKRPVLCTHFTKTIIRAGIYNFWSKRSLRHLVENKNIECSRVKL